MDKYENWLFNYSLKLNQRVSLLIRERDNKYYAPKTYGTKFNDKPLHIKQLIEPRQDASVIRCERCEAGIRRRLVWLYSTSVKVYYSKKCKSCTINNNFFFKTQHESAQLSATERLLMGLAAGAPCVVEYRNGIK